jgi:hypothetical protein
MLARRAAIFPSMYPALLSTFRRAILDAGGDPDEMWCRTCQTDLEQLRDNVADAAPLVLRLAATVVAFIPGVGTGVASILGAAASLAEGKTLSEAAVDGMLSAVPGGPAWAAAAGAGRSLLKGERIDTALLAAGREAVRQQGGDKAAALYDGVIAVCQGKSLQDAGFAALQALAKGNDVAERAAHYAEVITRAAESGRPVAQVLAQDLATDVRRAAGTLAFKQLDPLIERIKLDPSLLNLEPAQLAALQGVPEAVAQAARAIMRTGSEDTELRAIVVRPPWLETQDSMRAEGGTIDILRTAVYQSQIHSATARKSSTSDVLRQLVAEAKPVASKPAPPPPTPPVVPTPKPAPLVGAGVVKPPADEPSSSVALGAGLGVAGVVVAWAVWGRR